MLDSLQTFNVTYTVPVNITHPPISKEVKRAGTVRLNCTATGSPKPKIYWYKDGEPLVLASRVRINMVESFTGKIVVCAEREPAWCSCELIVISTNMRKLYLIFSCHYIYLVFSFKWKGNLALLPQILRRLAFRTGSIYLLESPIISLIALNRFALKIKKLPYILRVGSISFRVSVQSTDICRSLTRSARHQWDYI